MRRGGTPALPVMCAALLCVALLHHVGCTGDPEAPGPGGGWVEEIVLHPERFTLLMADHREGWVALHRNDWISALSEGGVPAQRAAQELGRFYRVLGTLSDAAWLGLGGEFEARKILPVGSLLPLFVRFAADQAGDVPAAARWQGIAEGRTPEIAALARAFRDVRPPGSPASLQGPLAERLRLHRGLQEGTVEWAALRVVASQPVLLEPMAESGSSRALYDPLIYRSLQAGVERQAGGRVARPGGVSGGVSGGDPGGDPGGVPDASSGAGLESLLFSGQLGLQAAGIALPAEDGADACRVLVEQVDALLDSWHRQLGAGSSEEGRAILEDLRLIEGTRARYLIDRAEEVLPTRPRCAWTLASLAMDHNHGRTIGPINSPTLYAILASASFRLGHRREAMDTLQVLVDSYPEVVPLDETIGDLVVLDAMGRSGDSKEH